MHITPFMVGKVHESFLAAFGAMIRNAIAILMNEIFIIKYQNALMPTLELCSHFVDYHAHTSILENIDR